MLLIILAIPLAILIALLTAQALAIWRGRARYGSLLASQQALAAQNAADFNAVLVRLASAGQDASQRSEQGAAYV